MAMVRILVSLKIGMARTLASSTLYLAVDTYT